MDKDRPAESYEMENLFFLVFPIWKKLKTKKKNFMKNYEKFHYEKILEKI